MLHCNDIDGLMVDWLYGELDDSRATEVSGHVSGCARCQTEQAAFSRTRELFSALPSEEPPSSLTAMLMREAAMSAKRPAAAASPTAVPGGFAEWLTRLFRPLMHPAAAAIATLVVVVGIAGLLYVNKGEEQFAQPSVTSAVDQDEAAMAVSEQEAASVPVTPSTSSIASPSSTAALEGAGDEAKMAAALDGTGKAGKDGEEDEGLRADLLEAERASKLREKSNRQKQQAARIASPSPTRKSPAKPGASQDPAGKRKQAPASVFADADSPSDTKNEAFGYRGQKGEGWAQEREAALVRAYKGDDCLATARIANDIRERAPSFYESRTAELDAVKKCRQYVEKERKRRASVASRKAAKKPAKKKTSSAKGGKKGGKGAKGGDAKAAPQDELDATATD